MGRITAVFSTSRSRARQLKQETGGLTPKLEPLIHILEWVRIEEFVGASWCGWGRPPHERAWFANAFVAKAVLGLTTTAGLIERLRVDWPLRRVCGFSLLKKLRLNHQVQHPELRRPCARCAPRRLGHPDPVRPVPVPAASLYPFGAERLPAALLHSSGESERELPVLLLAKPCVGEPARGL